MLVTPATDPNPNQTEHELDEGVSVVPVVAAPAEPFVDRLRVGRLSARVVSLRGRVLSGLSGLSGFSTGPDPGPNSGLNSGSSTGSNADATRRDRSVVDLVEVIASARVWWATAIIWAVGVARLVLVDPLRSRFALFFPDSIDYFDKAKVSIFSPGRVLTMRPPVYPYFVSLCMRNPIAVVVVQTMLYLAAFVWLANEVKRLMPGRVLPFIAGVLILAFGASPTYAFWGSLPLTESLACTLVVASAAAWIRWSNRLTRGWAVMGIVLGALAGLLRDATATLNAFLAFGLLFVAVVLRLAFRKKYAHILRVILALSVVWVSIGVYSLTTARHTGRTRFSFYDVTGMRILPDQNKLAWFVDHGMPMSPALKERTGHSAWDDNWLFVNGPELKTYRTWADEHGNAVLAQYLLTHPGPSVIDAVDFVRRGLLDPNRDYDRHSVGERLGPNGIGPLKSIQRIAAPTTSSRAWFAVFAGLFCALSTAMWGQQRLRNAARILLLVGATGFFSAFLEFHADSLEIGRHLSSAMLRIRLFGLLGLLLGAASAVLFVAQRKGSRSISSASKPMIQVDTVDRTDTADSGFSRPAGTSPTYEFGDATSVTPPRDTAEDHVGNTSSHNDGGASVFQDGVDAGRQQSFSEGTYAYQPSITVDPIDDENNLAPSEPSAAISTDDNVEALIVSSGTLNTESHYVERYTYESAGTRDATKNGDAPARDADAEAGNAYAAAIDSGRALLDTQLHAQLDTRLDAQLDTRLDVAPATGPVIAFPAWAKRAWPLLSRALWFLVVWLVGRPLGERAANATVGISQSQQWLDMSRSFAATFLRSPSLLFSLLQRISDLLGQVLGHKAGSTAVLQLVLTAMYSFATWRCARGLSRMTSSIPAQVISVLIVGFVSLEARNILWVGLGLPDALRLSLILLLCAELLPVRSMDDLRRAPLVAPVTLLILLSGGPAVWTALALSTAGVLLSLRTPESDQQDVSIDRSALRPWNVNQRSAFILFVSSCLMALVSFFLARNETSVESDSRSFASQFIRTLTTRFSGYDIWSVQYRANLRAVDILGTLARIAWPTGGGLMLLWPLLAVGGVVRLVLNRRSAQRPSRIGASGSSPTGLSSDSLRDPSAGAPVGLVVLGAAIVIYAIVAAFSPANLVARAFVPFWFALVVFALGSLTTTQSHLGEPEDRQDPSNTTHTNEMITFDSAVNGRDRNVADRHFDLASLISWIVASPLLLLVTLASLRTNEFRARDYDAIPLMDTAHRINRIGGTYFTSASDVKGPLFQLVYHLATLLGGRRDPWWIISVLIIVTASVTGIAVGVLVWSRSHSRLAATFVGVGLYIFLVSSKQAFAGILYSRNITTMLAAIAMALVATTRSSKDRGRPTVAGICLGIGASTISAEILTFFVAGVWLWLRFPAEDQLTGGQTNLASTTNLDTTTNLDSTTTFDSSTGLGRLWSRLRRFFTDRVQHISRPVFRFASATLFSFATPSLWYLARGVFHEYWYYWFRYSGFYYSSTGRSFSKVIRHGFTELRAFYLREPFFGVIVIAFLGVLFFAGSRKKTAQLSEWATLGWWLSASMTITLAQRFSFHHFIVIAVPLFAMFGLILDRLLETPTSSLGAASLRMPMKCADRSDFDQDSANTTHAYETSSQSPTPLTSWKRPSVAVVTLVSTLCFLSFGSFKNVWREVRNFKTFKGFDEQSRISVDVLGGDMRTVRAFTEMVSSPDESVFVWSNQPWNPASFGRMPASRFIENRILKGYIYLGGTSPLYVPPHGWEQLQLDLERSNASLFIDNTDDPFPPGTPLQSFLDQTYVQVLKIDKWVVRMRKDRLAALVAAPSFSPTESTDTSCYELSGVLTNPGPAATAPFIVRADDATRPGSSFILRVSGSDVTAAFSGKNGEFPQYVNPIAIPTGTNIRVLIGRRAVVLLSDNTIVSAVLRETVTLPVVLSSGAGGVQLGDLRTIPRPDCFGVPA
jgi:hypothetical protein